MREKFFYFFGRQFQTDMVVYAEFPPKAGKGDVEFEKNLLRKLGSAAIAAGFAASAFADASDAGNHGAWIGVQAKYGIDTNRVWTINASEESRFGEKHYEEQHGTLGVTIKPFSWLAITPHYHFIDTRKRISATRDGDAYVTHDWQREHRFGVDVEPSVKLWGWKIADRNRVVWRDFEDSQGFWRYRNRIQVNSPWKWTDYKINPYASWELFLDDGKPSKHVRKNDKFDQWRFAVGATAKLTDNISLNLFYLLQEKKNTSHHDWSPNHVLGVNVGFSF